MLLCRWLISVHIATSVQIVVALDASPQQCSAWCSLTRTLMAASTLALGPQDRHPRATRRRCEAAGLTPDGLYGGDVDVPLSERGEAEARAAAQFVADTFGSKVNSVFASPMKRAMRRRAHGRSPSARDEGRSTGGLPRS